MVKMYEEELLTKIPELGWEGLIKDIVKKDNMDPWDVDIVKLTKKFFDELKERDIVLTGKFLLASAFLLRMKSENMSEEYEYYLAELAGAIDLKEVFDMPEIHIFPKFAPQVKRKVTVDELVSALRKAMSVKERKDERWREREKSRKIRLMFKSVNIEEKISNLAEKLRNFFRNLGKKRLSFSEITPSQTKDDVIWTFMPLLHLASKGQVNLVQEEPFGDIYVEKAD